MNPEANYQHLQLQLIMFEQSHPGTTACLESIADASEVFCCAGQLQFATLPPRFPDTL
jgi:hypothetical protein